TPDTDPLGDYSASITWGDGSPATSGNISLASGTFSVSGSHTYLEEGTFAVSVTITHTITESNQQQTTTASTAAVTVADAGVTATRVTQANVNEAQLLNGTMATFTDQGGAEVVGD